MALLTNECPICTEIFKNSDDIYTTTCGHIYHFSCMNEWRRNGTSCPQCRVYNPSVFKIFLTFEEREPQNPETIEELELKLKSAIEKNAELVDQNNEIEINFLHLQEHCTTIEEERKCLEELIREMNDYENNFLNLQGQYTESSEFIKYLEDQIKHLIRNKESTLLSEHVDSFANQVHEVPKVNSELESIKSGIENGEVSMSDSFWNGKIKILEQKLKYITSELENEVTNSTKLTIENLKLQSVVDHYKSMENDQKNIALNQTNQVPNIKNNRQNWNKENQIKVSSDSKLTKNLTSTKVFIKNVPFNQITIPLENIIINLASKMNFLISSDDIINVKLIDNNNQFSSKAELWAEFKSAQLKNKFIANKNILKNYSCTNSIIIGEYMDDGLHSLLVYAKEKLRNNGFNYVFCRNDTIFAKKHRGHPKTIEIHDKAHVDSIQSKKQSTPDEVEDDSQKLTDSTVDENYYQL